MRGPSSPGTDRPRGFCFCPAGAPDKSSGMAQRCWLVKQEPETYAWSQFVADGRTAWTGVRSFPARIHLRAMQPGDPVLYYHSGESKEIVGLARVVRSAYPDPTATEGDWSAVDLEPVAVLPQPVTLAAIKGDPAFANFALMRQSRLSVMPVSELEFARLREWGGLKAKPPARRARAS